MPIALVDSRTARPAQTFPVRMIDLDVNEICNLRCPACYFGTMTGNKTPFEIGKVALDAIFYGNQEQGERRVHFFGGEVLLAWELIKELVGYGRECEKLTGFSFSWGCTSNITKLTLAMVEWFVTNRGNIHVSVDGSPRSHNRIRVRHDGKGSSDEVMANVPLALQITPTDSARMTVYPKTCQFLLESVEFFRQLNFRSAATVIVSEENWDSYWPVLDDQLSKVTQWWLALFKKGEVFRLKHLDDAMSSIVNPVKRSHPCGAGRTLLAVGVDGQVSPCHRFSGTMKHTMKLGKLGETLDFSILEPFQNFDATKHDSPKCRACEAWWECGGGCPAVNYLHSGNIAEKHPNDCKFSQMAHRHAEYAFEEAARLNPTLLAKLYGSSKPGKPPKKPWETE